MKILFTKLNSKLCIPKMALPLLVFAILGKLNAQITITSSPSSYSICEGKSVTFSTTVNGNALTYQWRKNSINILGANASNYQIASVTNTNAGNYDVIVSGITTDPALTGTPIFNPTNTISSFGGSSPSGEGVEMAIDGNVNTKYLNFGGNNTGFDIDAGTSSIANMLKLTTANDDPGRDPLNYEIYGSTDNITFNLIASGIMPCNSTRFFSNYFVLNNSTPYQYYRFKVPTICGGSATGIMQIAEVQLFSGVSVSTQTSSTGSLTVKGVSYGDTTSVVCNNLNWNGNLYEYTGNYTHAYTNYLGCDSIVTLHLTVLKNETYNPQTICFGGTYTFNGHTYSGTGVFNDTLQNVFGCDSIIITELEELPLNTFYNWQQTSPTVPYVINGNTYTTAGDYSDTLVSYLGCDSIILTHLIIADVPSVSNATICANNSVTLLGNSIENNYWYSDPALTNLLATSVNYTTPTLTNTTTYYVTGNVKLDYFKVDTLLDSNFKIVDHDDLTGDDRGGIAVTPNFVYITGDDYTARYKTDLTDSLQLPLRDGLFSDLKTGKIYSISNGIDFPENVSMSDPYYFSEIVELNDTLKATANVIKLSQTIVTGNYNTQGGIFAGKGFLVVYSGFDYKWYAVNLTNGKVDTLGYLSNAEFYGSENWADWGVAEFDGTNYSVIYRDYNDDNIHRRVLPDNASTIVSVFNDLNDMANITYSPWNNRWYFHHENDSQFGGDSETLGYADASDSSSVINTPSKFATTVVVTVETCTGINEAQQDSNIDMIVYPNPSTGLVNVNYQTGEVFAIQVIDALGKVMFFQDNNIGRATFNLSNFSEGIYTVKTISKNGNSYKNLIIVK